MLDFTQSVTMLPPSRSKFRGAPSGGVLQAGNGSGTCERRTYATFVPGPYSGSLVGHYEPARSDHGQRHKGQDAALARRKARGVTFHAQTIPAWSNPGSALSARHPPRLRGRRKKWNEGDPPGPEPKQGPIFF